MNYVVLLALYALTLCGATTDLCIGQDLESIKAYNDQFGQPITYMSYTNLTSLSGVFTPIDYGSGIQHAQALLNLQPGPNLNLGLWLGGLDGLLSIVNGELDYNINLLSKFVNNNPTSKIYLRIGANVTRSESDDENKRDCRNVRNSTSLTPI
ncbi:hypothetical protein TL16_g02043 [Triparma laevis f. inornata]|uniref:Uncharacterized protein n=1 Tax=Triparma laevis f. inornata TaxID=1714386 RepID=A0A9W7DV28_9STRA|nr:hypothetical protein TL16_g02043 [Triparma laevis f. inornata]